MNKGNDDLLLGQPMDLEEVAETLIAFCREDRLREILNNCFSNPESKQFHGIAEFIRDNWFFGGTQT